MEKRQKIIIALVVLVLIGLTGYFVFQKRQAAKPIELNNNQSSVTATTGPVNSGNVSPLSGLPCENWNRRALAVMQPSDLQARPAAGFSEADMVIEMPAYTALNTRLMGIYICNFPKEIGAIRSSRHDYIALAAGMDAIFVHWGGSHFALDLLKEKVIDNIEGLTYSCSGSPCFGKYFDRWAMTGKMRYEDTGNITKTKLMEAINDLGYRSENKFSGYRHIEEMPLENRPKGGHLRVAFAGPFAVEYDYDRKSNTYLRTWGNVPDFDRNNNVRNAPKNIAVLFAASSQITITQDYVGKGLKDPWKDVEEIKKTGVESISGRYNNVQIGDPWYDDLDSGDAFYYMNGGQYRGTWKKDKSDIASKLVFLDESGNEMAFVPGQMWVEILEPGQALRWTP